MISFIRLTDENSGEISKILSAERTDFEPEIFEIVSSFSDFSADECEFAFCVLGDFLLVRIFDGKVYSFVYPIALADGADEREALFEIGRYAMREEIPLMFCDVPAECVAALEEIFRFTESFCDDEVYTVSVLSEISRCDEIPELFDGELSLSCLVEDDIPSYAALCRDRELNKYWGYDVSEDAPGAPDEYFYNAAAYALDDGVAVSLAVRVNGEFVGEAVLWGFDLHGSAELAFRILPEFQGRGFGERALKLLIRLGDEIGLCEMRASVKRENIPSVKLLDRNMVCCHKGENVKRYLHKY